MVVHQANGAILPLNLFSPSLSLLWFSTLQCLNPFSHVFLLFIASLKWVNNDYPQYSSCKWGSSGLFMTYMGPTLEKGISGIGILNRHRVLLDGGVFKGIAEVFYGLNSEPSWVSRSPQPGAWPPPSPPPPLMLVRPTVKVAPTPWPMGAYWWQADYCTLRMFQTTFPNKR